MYENGDCIVTKTDTSGGLVKDLTLKEHLVYEVHDPENYIMPDGICDLTQITLENIGPNQVRIGKVGDKSRGKPRPENLKFCLAYNDGYISEEITIICGPKVFKQADKAKEFVRRRLDYLGLKPKEWLWQRIGWDSLTGPTVGEPPADYDPPELGIRVAFKCDTKEEARACRTECGHLCWGSLGVGAGFTQPPAIRPVFALWPTLIPREAVPLELEIKEAK